MKAIVSKILAAGTIIIALSLSALATPVQKMQKDTNKMAKKMNKKMSKMDSKMDSKMKGDKMMKKDTGKMKKM